MNWILTLFRGASTPWALSAGQFVVGLIAAFWKLKRVKTVADKIKDDKKVDQAVQIAESTGDTSDVEKIFADLTD